MSDNNNNEISKEIPFFCALLINRDMAEKIKTEIVASQFPTHVLNELNERKKKKANRDLNNDEQWNIFLIIGPFDKPSDAVDFHEQWKTKTRGVYSRVKKGTEMASLLGLEVYVDSDSNKEMLDIKQMYRQFKSKKS
jgi:beta-mannanase